MSEDIYSEQVITLEAGRASRHYWLDLWRYRELFAILAWRDIAVQYKQTVIGFAWALVRPAITMVIFTIVFGRIARLPADGGVPYPLLVMAGMLPWFLVSTVLVNGSNSLLSNSNLISKVYFPRLVAPLASSVVALVDFAITLVMMFAMMAWFGFAPGWQIVFLPLFTLLGVLVALGPALVMAALNVNYRDFRFIIPFAVQFGLYISPVGFSSAVVPEKWRLVYALNPAVAVIDGFRWSLLAGQTRFDPMTLAVALVVSAVFLVIGIRTFRKTENAFADLM